MSTRADRFISVALLLLGAAAVFTTGVWLFAQHMQFGAITADWGWLYRTGQLIRAHGLPDGDVFSWTYPGHPWVLYQWLFEALAAPVYDGLGLAASVFGVGLAGVAMYALVPALLLRRDGVHPIWPMLIGALVLLPVSTNLGLRPMLASNIALVAQYIVIRRLRAGDTTTVRAVFAMLAIYALWSNMHLGFTLGLLSIVLFAAGDLWTRARDAGATARGPGVYILLLVAAILASGINPYGWTLYAYIVHLSLETRMNAHIHELMPPRIGNVYMQVGLAMLAAYAVLALIYRRVLSAAETLHVVVFAALAFTAMRFVIWAALFYALIAPRLAAHAAARLAPVRLRGALDVVAGPTTQRATMAGLCVLAVLAITVGAPATAGRAHLAGCAPLRRSLNYLDQHYPPDTHWFSSETAGSCARFYTPDRSVFIDTRFDMFPEHFVLRWFYAYQYRRHWRAVFEHWGIRVALLPRGAPLVETLRHDADWHVVHADPGALVFESRGDEPAGRTGSPSAD